MSLPKTDAFTGPDDTNLHAYNAGWVYPSTMAGMFEILSNACASGAGGDHYIYWDSDTPNNDQYAQAKLAAVGGPYIGPGVRCSSNGAGYQVYFSGSTYVNKWVGGNYTGLYSGGLQWAVNDVMRIEAEGTTVRVLKNGGAAGIGPWTDSGIQSGKLGIFAYASGAGARLDDFEGGNLGVSAVSVALDALSLASSLPDIGVSPGAVSVLLDALTAASSLPAGSIAATVSILLDALSMAGSMPQAGISPGAVSLLLDALTLAGSLPAGSIATESGPQAVALDALTLAGSVPAAQIAAAVSVLVQALTAQSSVSDLEVQSAVSVLVQALTLQSQAPGLEVQVSGGVVNLEALRMLAVLAALVYQRRSSELVRRRGRFTPG